jgi:hypothetical protein
MDEQTEEDAVVNCGLGGVDITSMPRSCGSSKEYVADINSPSYRDISKEYAVSAEGMVKADIASMARSRDSSEDVVDITPPRYHDNSEEYVI